MEKNKTYKSNKLILWLTLGAVTLLGASAGIAAIVASNVKTGAKMQQVSLRSEGSRLQFQLLTFEKLLKALNAKLEKSQALDAAAVEDLKNDNQNLKDQFQAQVKGLQSQIKRSQIADQDLQKFADSLSDRIVRLDQASQRKTRQVQTELVTSIDNLKTNLKQLEDLVESAIIEFKGDDQYHLAQLRTKIQPNQKNPVKLQAKLAKIEAMISKLQKSEADLQKKATQLYNRQGEHLARIKDLETKFQKETISNPDVKEVFKNQIKALIKGMLDDYVLNDHYAKNLDLTRQTIKALEQTIKQISAKKD